MNRSFTAVTPQAVIVRVRIPDDQDPYVIKDGNVLASGVPDSIMERGFPALQFGDIGPLLPTAEKTDRKANSLSRADSQLTDVALIAAKAYLWVEGWPVLWAPRLGPREAYALGWTFTDGVASQERWTLDLEPAKRKCCGRRG